MAVGYFWLGCFGWLLVSALRVATSVIDLVIWGSLGVFGMLVWTRCLLGRAHRAGLAGSRHRDYTTAYVCVWVDRVTLTGGVVQIKAVQTSVCKFRFAELGGGFVTHCGWIAFAGVVSLAMLIVENQYWTGLVLVCQAVGLIKVEMIRLWRCKLVLALLMWLK